MEEPDVSIRQEAPMPYSMPTQLERWPMSFEEFLELPEHVHAEWIDGVAVVTPAAKRPHQRIGRRLANLIEAACPELEVDMETGVQVGPQRFRVPDVSALATWDGEQLFTQETPVLVAEVLSPSTRREDLLRKTDEYRRAGIDQYWIVDPDEPSLTVLRNDGDAWSIVLDLDEASPTGEITVGEYGVVAVDLTALLDRRG